MRLLTPGNTRRTCLPGRILDVLWPRGCEVCGRPSDRPGRHVCSDCLNRLPFAPVDGCCRRCGRDALGLDGEFVCEDCRVNCPHFDRAASAVRYDGEARELVNAFKFRSRLWLRDDLVDWLEGVLRARFRINEIDVVLAMPSTILHRWNRGYNQAVIMARALARRIDRPYRGFVIRRKGHPMKQSGLNEEERRVNALDTFSVMRPSVVAGKTALVVDDIMTTGSTLSECAAVLRRAGTKRVWCVSVARSLRSV